MCVVCVMQKNPSTHNRKGCCYRRKLCVFDKTIALRKVKVDKFSFTLKVGWSVFQCGLICKDHECFLVHKMVANYFSILLPTRHTSEYDKNYSIAKHQEFIVYKVFHIIFLIS